MFSTPAHFQYLNMICVFIYIGEVNLPYFLLKKSPYKKYFEVTILYNYENKKISLKRP